MRRWGDEWEQTGLLASAATDFRVPSSKFIPKYSALSRGREAVEKTTQILEAYLIAHQAHQAKHGNGQRR